MFFVFHVLITNNIDFTYVAKISTEDDTNSPSDESDPNVPPPEVKNDGGNSGGNGSGKEEKSGQNETDKQERFGF